MSPHPIEPAITLSASATRIVLLSGPLETDGWWELTLMQRETSADTYEGAWKTQQLRLSPAEMEALTSRHPSLVEDRTGRGSTRIVGRSE